MIVLDALDTEPLPPEPDPKAQWAIGIALALAVLTALLVAFV